MTEGGIILVATRTIKTLLMSSLPLPAPDKGQQIPGGRAEPAIKDFQATDVGLLSPSIP
jgi:hypothetical protein